MARKGVRPARPAAGHDVERTLDELYATPPSDFVSRRERLAAEAKRDGRADDARRIHGARRPTLAAWAANLLLRSKPRESGRFLEPGRALREAPRAGWPGRRPRRRVDSTSCRATPDNPCPASRASWAACRENRLHELSAGRDDAAASLRRARDRHDRAREHESAAQERPQERPREARQELRRAAQEQQEAEERLRTAVGAVDRAERASRDAAQEVARLTQPITWASWCQVPRRPRRGPRFPHGEGRPVVRRWR
ncbi:hypothetical protein ACFU6S_23080 [Streptomyces sp. NPDC057456]|uniref:hypothetical protein n=1 Tax=Streptomyces sp. NPDC057456 TaxID=3346139 RepID=UPI0036A8657C